MEPTVPVELLPQQITAPQSINKVELSVNKPILPPIGTQNGKIDYLPSNLLATLTQASKKYDDLSPKSVVRKKFVRSKVDNVWNHKKGRLKFKHLMEQPPCYCGAGRDISYLLDAVTDKSANEPIQTEETHAELENQEIINYTHTNVPDSIIPSEFHVIKHKGVVGLEMHDDKYTTKTENHEDHLTVFPSMKPSGRQEALQLMKTMNSLLKRAGIDDDETKDKQTLENERNGNQIENLLSIVKNEQKIYNIVFNEVIRQVSIECVERGAVLAELRKRYADMLDRIPKQVKSLHEEVLAQRALDRRLTEELTRFKTSITLLTKELHEIHAHDKEVTRQATEIQVELNDALKESEKNASLLAEYHDLYELQRRRLDYQLSNLIEERDLWAGSAHMLSLKVTDKHSLITARRLHVHEKAWYKLANRFAVLLGHEDEKLLQNLAVHVHSWQKITDTFHEKLLSMETETCRRMKSVQKTLIGWGKKFERVVTPDEGSVHPLDSSNIQELFDVLKCWEEIFNSEAERFTGDILLSCEDNLLQLNACVDLWIETALKIFANHPSQDGSWHTQHSAMITLNKSVAELHNEFKLRMSGENGLAKHFIQFINSLDAWINKINVLLHGETLFESEWIQLADFFQVQWSESLQHILAILSPGEDSHVRVETPNFEERPQTRSKVDLETVYNSTQKWLNDTIDSFENENSGIMEQVTTTHSNMIRWIITILIRLAPDTEDANLPDGMVKEDKNSGLGGAILAESTSESIIDRATMIFSWLRSLSDLIIACCGDIVKYGQQPESTKLKDGNDLKKIQVECQGWMNTANLLIYELTGEMIPMDGFITKTKNAITSSEAAETEMRNAPLEHCDRPNTISSMASAHKKDATTPVINEVQAGVVDDKDEASSEAKYLPPAPDQSVEKASQNTSEAEITIDGSTEMHVIGIDENVKRIVIEDVAYETEDKQSVSNSIGDNFGPSLSVESLNTLQILQSQLLTTEERAQKAEIRAFEAESSLMEARERIRALERSLSRVDRNNAPVHDLTS